MWPVLFLLACASVPEIDGVTPDPVEVGAELRVSGSGLRGVAELVVRPEGEGPARALPELRTLIPGALAAKIPDDLPPGRYLLEARAGEQVVLAPGPLTVILPRPEVGCSGEWQTNTQISLAQARVTLHRYLRNGERRRVVVPLADVARLEVETSTLGDGSRCSAIYLRKADGRRLLYDDDRRTDLAERAKKLGALVNRPVDTAGAAPPGGTP